MWCCIFKKKKKRNQAVSSTSEETFQTPQPITSSNHYDAALETFQTPQPITSSNHYDAALETFQTPQPITSSNHYDAALETFQTPQPITSSDYYTVHHNQAENQQIQSFSSQLHWPQLGEQYVTPAPLVVWTKIDSNESIYNDVQEQQPLSETHWLENEKIVIPAPASAQKPARTAYKFFPIVPTEAPNRSPEGSPDPSPTAQQSFETKKNDNILNFNTPSKKEPANRTPLPQISNGVMMTKARDDTVHVDVLSKLIDSTMQDITLLNVSYPRRGVPRIFRQWNDENEQVKDQILWL